MTYWDEPTPEESAEGWARAARYSYDENTRLREALTRIRDGGSTFLYDGAGCARIAATALGQIQEAPDA